MLAVFVLRMDGRQMSVRLPPKAISDGRDVWEYYTVTLTVPIHHGSPAQIFTSPRDENVDFISELLGAVKEQQATANDGPERRVVAIDWQHGVVIDRGLQRGHDR